MEQRGPLLVTGLVILLILGIIAGTIYYLGRNSRRAVTSSPTPTSFEQNVGTTEGVNPNSIPNTGIVPRSTPIPTSPQPVNANNKVYTGSGFRMEYPKNWGILTCNNSANIEFDPANASDQRNLVCDLALKPITVLVNKSGAGCDGSQLNLGGNQFYKTRAASGDNINYRWCMKVAPFLDVTHRVSKTNPQPRATSKDDSAAQIETMLQTVRTGSGGS